MRMGIIIAGLVLVSAVCTAHAQTGWAPVEVRNVAVYACPGHPQIMATWPARCPYCQATLQRVAAPAGGAAAGGARGGGGSAGVAAGGPRGGGSSAAVGGQMSPRAGAAQPWTQQRGEGRDEESREQRFRGQEFGERFPNEERRERFRGEEFGDRFPDEGFRGEEFGEEFPNEGFEEPFGEDRFLGPQEVFPREQFGFGDEFMEPGFGDGFGNEGFGEG